MRVRKLPVLLLLFVFGAASILPGQQPATPASPAQPTPAAQPTAAAPSDIDVRMIRFKISAGDLPSAESILEYHKAEKGEDTDYLMGLAWVARGAALTGDWKAASKWAETARATADSKLKSPVDYESNREAVYLLGTSIEVRAQSLEATGKKAEAIRFLDESSRTLEAGKAPYNIRARVWKRRNMIELEGKPAPSIQAEDHVGAQPRSLEALRGKPVVLYFWWEACGDCRMQAKFFRNVVEKYTGKGVAFVAPTRFYSADRAEEKKKIEKSWKETYALPDSVSAPISDEAMLRYGVSATPTFVFLDRKGNVARYLPNRISEDRMSSILDDLLR